MPHKNPGTGHNAALDHTLLEFIRRIESVQSEIDEHKEDIKTIMGAAKMAGYKPKRVRDMLRLRKMENETRELMLRETNEYMAMCGLAGTPLGDAATAHDSEVH